MVNIDIKQLMWDKGLTQTDIADIMGVNQSVVSKFIRGIRTPLKHHMDKMIEHFGEEVIKYYSLPEDAFKPQTQLSEVTILDTEVVKEMRQEIKEEIEEEIREKEIKTTIVLSPDIIRDPEVNIKEAFKAGELDDYAKPTQDILPCHHAKVYTYCDDMEPEIRAREPVLVRLLPRNIEIVPGDMYFIDLPSGGVIRYIEREEGGKLYLRARNNAYGDIVIPRSEVQSLASVVQILRTPRSMSYKETTMAEMIVRKDAHISEMLTTNNKLIDELCKRNDKQDQLIEKLLK